MFLGTDNVPEFTRNFCSQRKKTCNMVIIAGRIPVGHKSIATFLFEA